MGKPTDRTLVQKTSMTASKRSLSHRRSLAVPWVLYQNIFAEGWLGELCRKRCTSHREDHWLEKSDKQSSFKNLWEHQGPLRTDTAGRSKRTVAKTFHWIKRRDTHNPNYFNWKPFWALLKSALPTNLVETLICTSCRTWPTEPEL